MRKHIIGFALFALIIGTAAAVVWFLNMESDIPVLSEPIAAESFDKSVTYKIESAVFDLDSGKLVSRVQLKWNGTGKRPDALWISATVSDDRKKTRTSFGSELINEPFRNGDQVVVTSTTPGGFSPKLDGAENYYALFSVTADRSIVRLSENTATSKMPVLFVHGEGSKIAK
jgi:hypothetical protein